MDAEQVATFLSIIVAGGTLGAIVAASRSATREQLAEAAPSLTALIAVGATAASLYFSESAGFVPCELCWFQRIAMYPLAILLPIAALRRDRSFVIYSLVLSTIGLVISGYHVQLQLFPDQSSFCDAVNPCSGRWVEAFGWMTIPQMAGLSFALIAGLSTLSLLTPLKE